MNIILKRFEYDEETGNEILVTIREAKVKDMDSLLIDIVNEIIEEGYTILYYVNEQSKDLAEDGVFTYILKNGRYEWYVPVEDVTVREFALTHGIKRSDDIVLIEEGIGGGGLDIYVNSIVEWIPYFMQAVGYYFTIEELCKRMLPLYHKLIGRNRKVASTFDFMDMLRSRKSWTMSDIKRKTTIVDSNLIELMLMEAGFEKKGSRYILTRLEETEDDLDYEDDATEYDDDDIDLEDEFDEEYMLDEINETVKSLNECLLSLMIQSDYYQLDSYNNTKVMIKFFVEEWKDFIKEGSDLEFIEITDACKTLTFQDLFILNRALESIAQYVSVLCAKIDGVVID